MGTENYDVCDHDDQCQCNIENCHKRYNDLGYLCDSLDSASLRNRR